MLEIKAAGMPQTCYVVVLGNAPGTRIGMVKLGSIGYWPTPFDKGTGSNCFAGIEDCKRKVRELNAEDGVTELQEDSMSAGSCFGWDCHAADPAYMLAHYPDIYNADGSRKAKVPA